MLSYNKLWNFLETRGMKKTDLKEVISGNTLAKLGKNETISSSVIEKICEYLNCQPGDIMEYVNEEKVMQIATQFGNIQQALVEQLKEQGISEEEYIRMVSEAVPLYFEKVFKGENPMQELLEKALHEPEEGTQRE